MKTFKGNYFDGSVPVPQPATLDFEDRQVILTTETKTHYFDIANLTVSPRIGNTERFFAMPNGGQFSSADHSFWDTLPQESKSEGPVAWLEQRIEAAISCVVVIACLLFVGYFYGLPAAAKHVVKGIPMETESLLGEQVISYFDKKNWMTQTELDRDVQDEITKGCAELIKNLPFQEYYRLEFRASNVFGANAFALPGGIIIITDDMVNMAESLEEVLAIIAHEIGHVELRHTMRIVLQNSAVGLAVATITGDVATLSAAITGLPMLLAQMKYSRDFEHAADEYSFDLLKQHGYSPAAFASIMERLSEQIGGPHRAFAYLSSHPLTEERIQSARDAAVE